ncbi:NCS2 family permease [Phenylobacterium montanum]|uniref:NCS2 family permease n=2 Tax=Phenylobacterium montanum TaxID=2823693 RepID=A0A975G4V6_9CAUL|nr:NCS2 family permease [Caulobacter sp. S6]
MAYIVAVNPSILGLAGMPVAAVAAATCFSAGIASILMGLTANVPLALAPGMGLNAYFTFTVVQQMHVAWPTALGCVFLSGCCFMLLTLAGVRRMIVSAIPPSLFAAVAGGIGLFIAFIGLRNAGVVVSNPDTSVALGNLKAPGAALSVLGLVLIVALTAWRVKGAMLIGILATTAAGWAIGLVHFTAQPYGLTELGKTAFALDIPGAFRLGGGGLLSMAEIVFVFLFVDVFDNIGTLVAVTRRAGLQTPEGEIPNLNRILIADAAASMIGALAGTSTVTSYVESAAGVQAGGRTGLAAIVTGLLFLATMLAAPFAQAVPLAATAPALILVGALMMAPVAEIAWEDPVQAIPGFLTLIMIPLTFSIANGLAFGVTAYAAIKLIRREARVGDWLLFLLAALFVARFVYMSAA